MTQKKLLIIEDDEIFSQSLKKILQKNGFDCKISHHANQALEEIKTFRPSHIILDLKLGEDDGEKLVQPIKAELPLATIIILTGFGTIPSAVKALKNGATDYLTKPIEVDDLIKSLHKNLTPPKKDLKELEDEHILENLKHNEGNISKTAKDLGLHRRTLQRKLKKMKDYT
jgi:two-component system response regulator RegA